MINLDNIEKKEISGQRMLTFAGFGTPILASVLEMANQIDPANYPFWAGVHYAVDESSLWFYGLFLITFVFGKFLSKDGTRLTWEAIQANTDKLQNLAFPGSEYEINDHYRVTLFRHKRWSIHRILLIKKLGLNLNKGWLPWRGWLVPVIRSNHTGKESKISFFAPDSGERAEGIAGKCWASDFATREPELPRVISMSSERQKLRYCSLSKIDKCIVDFYCKTGKTLSRDILAFPVLTASGKRWGVMVYDSTEPNSIDEDLAKNGFETILSSLGVLLEGV